MIAATCRRGGIWLRFSFIFFWEVTDTAWFAFLAYLIVFDFVDYWIHRGQHGLHWWWALHSHPYASLRSVWWQWWAQASASHDQPPRFVSWVISHQAEAIIVNDNIRDDVRAFPDALQQQFWAYVSACTTPVLDLMDASYLRIELDRITRPPPALEICGGTRLRNGA